MSLTFDTMLTEPFPNTYSVTIPVVFTKRQLTNPRWPTTRASIVANYLALLNDALDEAEKLQEEQK